MFSCLQIFVVFFFFFNDTATTEIYTLSLHDALPIYYLISVGGVTGFALKAHLLHKRHVPIATTVTASRSEEHTSELQSRQYLVCRLLLEKKKKFSCLQILEAFLWFVLITLLTVTLII